MDCVQSIPSIPLGMSGEFDFRFLIADLCADAGPIISIADTFLAPPPSIGVSFFGLDEIHMRVFLILQ